MSQDLTGREGNGHLQPFDPRDALVASGGRWPGPSGSFEDEERGGDWRRYLSALLRHKWAILAVVALGTVLGFMIAQRLQYKYTAQATIWIELSDRQAVQAGPIQAGELLQNAAWVDLLRSYVVLDHVVRSQRLFLDYKSPADSMVFAGFTLGERFRPGDYRLEISEDGRAYELKADRGFVVSQGLVGDSIGAELGFAWQPGRAALGRDRAIEFSVLTPRDASIRLSEELQTRLPERNGNFMRLELEGTNASRLASTLNALAERYVEVAGDLKRGKAEELTEILREQLTYAETNLREAEMELEAFRVATITLPSEPATPVTPGLEQTRMPVFDRFFDMRIEREQIRRDREELRTALAEDGADVAPTGRLWSIGSVQGSVELKHALDELTLKQAELRSLRIQYTDAHPQVAELAQEVASLETVVVPRLARALDAQLEQRDAVLEELLGSASTELRQVPPRMIEEARLRRHVAIAENLFTMIQSRYESARLAAVSSIPDVRILDDATVPHRPTNPDAKPMAVAMAFLLSLGVGVGGSILRDRTDGRVRYPKQVTDEIGLPILGGIPMAATSVGDSEQTEQVIEAFRELRLSLVHAHGAAGPVVVTITSPGSGDGKSFVSSNLALAFADQGHRTLLVDGDIRRGTLHNVLGRERTPGLTDFLAGTLPEERLIQSTDYPNVDFIGSGTWRRSGPELLGSVEMRRLLVSMRARYSVIIVDSAPLGAGVDPYVLGTITGNLLMVLRTGTTDRELAGAKLETLTRLPVRILGAVLNAVPNRGIYKYYSYFSNYQLPPPDERTPDEEPVAAG